MRRLVALGALLMLAACGDSTPVVPKTRVTAVAGHETLRDAFVRAAGAPRLVLFLSPT